MKISISSDKKEKLSKWHETFWSNIQKATALSNAELKVGCLAVALFYFLFLNSNYSWISDLPDALFDPPPLSMAILWSGFPSSMLITILQSLLVISIGSLGISRFPRSSLVLFCLSYFILNSARYSLGKIDHTIMAPLAIICLGMATVRAKNIRSRLIDTLSPIRPEALLALALSFGMFSAGYPKLLNWIDLDLSESGFLRWFYSGYLNNGRTEYLADMVPHFHPWFIEALDYMAVVFELSPLLFLLSGKPLIWRLWLTMACLFHLGNLLLLNINFTGNTLCYLPFLIPASLVTFFYKKQVYLIFSLVTIGITIWSLLYMWNLTPAPNLLIYRVVDSYYVKPLMWCTLSALGCWKCLELWLQQKRVPAPL
ncbi:hypothetical protein [Rubritalea sp.]|uniref:hypothetical protein n=1 Tax=Rubritalea sp. TaxID=2109375 RepID=UPI003EF22815